MTFSIRDSYFKLVLQQPFVVLLLALLVLVFFGYHSKGFRLDASADSLVLENDQALDYYRSIRARYGSDDFLIVTYTPRGALFSDRVLTDLRVLRDAFRDLPRVESVVSLLDVPLIQSPPQTLSQLQQKVPTLEAPGTDRGLAREELINSPLYRCLVICPDGRTTALQIFFQRDEKWHRLLRERDELRERQLQEGLTPAQREQLALRSRAFDSYSAQLQDQLDRDIAAVRDIMARHRDDAELHLGGVPMIVSDSINFIRHDLRTFGIGVAVFLLGILAAAFRKPRWIILPLLTCGATGVITVGILGLLDWPVTVVSSNFISLLLIITLSLNVHLIVRYRELHALSPHDSQHDLVRETLRSKAAPCFYTAITTVVAFGSLLFSDIRPVIDFGWMMSIGIGVAFVLVFTLFPAALVLLKPGRVANQNDWTDRITGFFAHGIKAFGTPTLAAFALFAGLSVVGISWLTVENRFIDYFKESTEIYRGMELIDRRLGGTTPLDVVVDPPAYFSELADEDWQDPLMDETEAGEGAGITGTSYWFNTFQLPQVAAIHQYLDSLPETGKVLSVDTAMQMLGQIDRQIATDNFLLAVFHKKLPDDIRKPLFEPYMSDDGNQVRFALRVFESDPSLQREALLIKIREHLVNNIGLEPEQIHLSGMLVLYNNMLQSLFRSQILTIGVVFLAIMVMFAILFRNLRMASVAIVPNVFAAALVLGLMGWSGVPLDIMTITIAAISIGIAVDDTIHYVHRFTEEFRKDGDYWAAVKRSHATIGRAMYYTTVTITLGFSILALSNFIPTIYFGLLTGFAMMVALLADLTLLPLLIVKFKPLGKLEVVTETAKP